MTKTPERPMDSSMVWGSSLIMQSESVAPISGCDQIAAACKHVAAEYRAMQRIDARQMHLTKLAYIKTGARLDKVEAAIKNVNKVLPYFVLVYVIESVTKEGL